MLDSKSLKETGIIFLILIKNHPIIRNANRYPTTKPEGYSFGVVGACVRASVHSVRPSIRLHFLSVWNHISVPISKIWIILDINDKYHKLPISYKFG